ncbi:hypothetical protein STEG23_031941, partial [Scotinomys teguina]
MARNKMAKAGQREKEEESRARQQREETRARHKEENMQETRFIGTPQELPVSVEDTHCKNPGAKQAFLWKNRRQVLPDAKEELQ